MAKSTCGKKWDRTVRFRDLLSDDTSDENAQRVGKAIAERVNQAIPETDDIRDDQLTEIIEDLTLVGDCDELNSLLSDLYDWGDFGKRMFVEL